MSTTDTFSDLIEKYIKSRMEADQYLDDIMAAVEYRLKREFVNTTALVTISHPLPSSVDFATSFSFKVHYRMGDIGVLNEHTLAIGHRLFGDVASVVSRNQTSIEDEKIVVSIFVQLKGIEQRERVKV